MLNNVKSNTYSSFSDIINVKKLEHETHKLLYLGFVVSICFHAAVLSYISFKKPEKKQIKHITVDLVVRHPVKTRPFMVGKKPVRKKALFRKEPGFRMPSAEIGTKPLSIPGTPYHEYVPEIEYETENMTDMFADSLRAEEHISRLPKDTIPMKDRLLFDTGEYKAEVIVSPDNKKAIQGYAHLLYVWGERFDPPDTLHHPVIDLAETVNRYTNISATAEIGKDYKIGHSIPFYPFIYITTDNLFKIKNQFRYLTGGFFIIDNNEKNDPDIVRNKVHKKMSDIFGWAYSTRPIMKNHPLFHCFFDFDNGPPPGEVTDTWNVIEGIYCGSHLAGIYCSQGYGSLWKDERNEAQLKLGVNFVVHALAPGKWYNRDIRLSFNDTAKKEYIEWYENGQVKFKASQYGQTGISSSRYGQFELSSVWLPKAAISNNRIVSYTINLNRPERNFDPNLVKTVYQFVYDSDGLKTLPWGVNNTYEGWYENGQKMYYYNYNNGSFVEWDEYGDIMAQSENNIGNNSDVHALSSAKRR